MKSTKYLPTSLTLKTRRARRAAVANMKKTRYLKPIVLSALMPFVHKHYQEAFRHAMKSGEQMIVLVRLCPEFLQLWIEANGLNRSPRWNHCEGLAAAFRSGFDTSCSHFVLCSDGYVGNGGHSGKAYALANFSKSFWGENSPHRIWDGESSQWVPAEPPVSKSWQFVPEYIQDRDEYAQLAINAPITARLKMDDLRIGADYGDYIEMCDATASWLDSQNSIDTKTVAQSCLQWYNRTSQGKDGFGTIGKGGRQNRGDAPAWMLTIVPMLEDSLALLADETGAIRLHNGLASSLALKDLLTAMIVSPQIGRERIAKSVTRETVFGAALCDKLTKPVGKAGKAWAKPKPDWIVTILVQHGRNGKQELGDGDYQLATGRASGFDSHKDDTMQDGAENREQVIQECAKSLAGQSVGGEQAAKATERKAKRVASAKTRKTTRKTK